MREGERPGPSGLPWPDVWSVRSRRGRLKQAAIGATGVVLLGVAYLWWPSTAYESPFVVVGTALMGAALVLLPLVVRTGRGRGSVSHGVRRLNGVEHRGAVFRVRRTFRVAWPAFFAAFGGGAAAFALAGGDPIILLLGTGTALCGPILFVGGLGFRGIVLTPDLVVVRAGMHRTALRIPWTEIGEVAADEKPAERDKGRPLIVLAVLDASHLRVRWWPRVKYEYFGVRDAETTIQAGRFAVDPALLLYALRHYLDFPGDRHELAGAKAIDRIRAGKPGARRPQEDQVRPVRRS